MFRLDHLIDTVVDQIITIIIDSDFTSLVQAEQNRTEQKSERDYQLVTF